MVEKYMWSKPIRPQGKSFALFPGITTSKTPSRHIDNSVYVFLSLFLESFGAIFFLEPKQKSRVCMKFSGNLWSTVAQRCLNSLFQRTLFLLPLLFRIYLNPQVRINKMVNSVDYHPCPSRLSWSIHFFVSINSIGLYISLPNAS